MCQLKINLKKEAKLQVNKMTSVVIKESVEKMTEPGG